MSRPAVTAADLMGGQPLGHAHRVTERETMMTPGRRRGALVPNVRRSAFVALAVGLGVVATGCGGGGHKQTTLTPHGSQARDIANLINPVFYVAAVIFVLILGGALFISLKFRAKDDADFYSDEVSPRQVHGKAALEIGWTIAPALILAIIAVPTVGTIFTLAKPAPKHSVHVEVIGQQWWWEYRYDLNGDGKYDNITTPTELVVPEGEKIQLSITSRDVIHSFWIPALNGKKDAVPNHHSPLIFQTDKVGHEVEYVGQCTEFCGLSHANMRMKVISLPRAAFDRWAANQQKKSASGTFPKDNTSEAAQGQSYFLGAKCSMCHVIDGVDNKNFVKTQVTAENFGESGKASVTVQHEIKNGDTPFTTLQESGAAPNLTHLMTRTTFAGGEFNLRVDDGPDGYCTRLGINWATEQADQDRCLDVPALKSWLRDPPGVKPMAPDPVPGRTGGRGMPNLNLSESQIDQVVAYLKTLK